MVARVPTEAGNQIMKDATGVKTLEDYLDKVKPEADYFSEQYGERTFFIVVDLPAPDAILRVVKPLFKLGARVEIRLAFRVPRKIYNFDFESELDQVKTFLYVNVGLETLIFLQAIL